MKKQILLLSLCLITVASAQRPSIEVVTEKRFKTLVSNEELYCMDSTNGDVWQFDSNNMRWSFIGSPRGASSRRRGGYVLELVKPGELVIFDTESGEAWWTNGVIWKPIDEPSTRAPRGK